MGRVEKRLQQLGVELPPVAKPQASYIPTSRTGNLVYVSGQGVTYDGKAIKVGHVGAELTLEEGVECARICALNALAALKAEVGDLDNIKKVVKVMGFVNSAPGFESQPTVMNGCSDFLEEVFGEVGRHARTAISCNELPFGTPVEVEMIVEVVSV